MTHSPIDVAVNPNDQAQRYVLWTNGRIDAVGGAPPTGGKVWYEFPFTCAMALHITDWVTGEGYMLDTWGGFWPLNGAPDLRTADQPGFDEKVVPGIPVQGFRCYIDWSWDPDGSGQGYVLDLWGQLYPFGGATVAPRSGPRMAVPIARRLKMQWSPTKYAVTLDMNGGLYGDFGLEVVDVPGFPVVGNRYWTGQDAARDVAVTDWASTPIKGYTLDLNGVTWPFGGAPVSGAPGGVFQRADVARAFRVLSAEDPTRLWQVWASGQQFEYVFSDPPSVTAGGASGSPAATVSDTTRPVLAWSYSDPQSDSQVAWQLLVFTQAFVDGHSMTDPLKWVGSALVAQEGNQRTARGLTSPVDLSNGTYRMYVRAQDSSGKWSAWSNRGWTQDVALPATPTGLTAVASNTTFSVLLSVDVTVGDNADLVLFECSDDDGATWMPVRRADAVPATSNTMATDHDPRLGVERTYRATAYSIEPRVASAPSGTATATVTRRTYVLTSTADPALGGEVIAIGSMGWSREAVAGVFMGKGAKYPTVVSDGPPKARTQDLTLRLDSRAEALMVNALINSDAVLLLRDPFGEAVYCRIVGRIPQEQQREMPRPDEDTPLRHHHEIVLPLVEVVPPQLVAGS